MKKKPIKKKSLKVKKVGSSQQRERLEKLNLILALTLQTASLELKKNEYIELAPVLGMCGTCRLSGNSLPVFEYRVFDPRKKPFMMEFIKVRVEISKPDRIQYIATIDSHGSHDPARHGEVVPVLEKYMEPFQKLSGFLKAYFPYYRNPMLERCENRWDRPKEVA